MSNGPSTSGSHSRGSVACRRVAAGSRASNDSSPAGSRLVSQSRPSGVWAHARGQCAEGRHRIRGHEERAERPRNRVHPPHLPVRRGENDCGTNDVVTGDDVQRSRGIGCARIGRADGVDTAQREPHSPVGSGKDVGGESDCTRRSGEELHGPVAYPAYAIVADVGEPDVTVGGDDARRRVQAGVAEGGDRRHGAAPGRPAQPARYSTTGSRLCRVSPEITTSSVGDSR